MLETPFEIISCSWPRPIRETDGRWISDPEWDSPLMPYSPQAYWEVVSSELCWMIDWREFFRSGLKVYERELCGEMKCFHIIFHLRVSRTGTLAFWDDDGSVIRRNGELIHTDRSAHMLERHEIKVNAGDVLEVAQWQYYGGWLWGAYLESSAPRTRSASDLLLPYLPQVQRRLADPNGPPLKFYTHGRSALRAILSVYSLILHGYAPSEVLLFGEDQWNQSARELFRVALPFAQVIPTSEVLSRIHSAGNSTLTDYARRYWFVMKTCVAFFYPPAEFGLMDDDVVVLDSVGDALQALADHDLVYAPDCDHGKHYQAVWASIRRPESHFSTGRFNAGLYWMRVTDDLRHVAARAIHVHPGRTNPYLWEQGFIACLYADRQTLRLPTERYFYPLFDGLPGGMLGYDYAHNPCGFASVHFGGLSEKPSDEAMHYLAAEILGPKNGASHHG